MASGEAAADPGMTTATTPGDRPPRSDTERGAVAAPQSPAPQGATSQNPTPQNPTPQSPAQLGWTRADTIRTSIALTIALALLATAWWLSATRGEGVGGRSASFTLLAGAGLGILFERGRFCFYCIFRDLFEERNSRGVYGILAAIGVGTLGYTVIFAMRLADPTGGQLPSDAHIGPVSIALVAAGLAFGIGVVISGGCIAGHLYRLGEGSLRALPALAGALLGFGLGFLTWNPIFRSVLADAPAPWLPAGGGYGFALLLQLGVLVGIGVLLLQWNPPLEARQERVITATEIRRRLFFTRWPVLATGAGVGVIGFVAFLRGEPLGVTSQLSGATRTLLDSQGLLPSTLLGLDQSLRGCVALVVETITSNGWLIVGILLGSLAAALPGRRVRLEPLTVRSTGTAVLGGVLIGWGAIIGLGCTVGVFLSGTQALALSGWVFAISVVLAMGVGFRLGWHRS